MTNDDVRPLKLEECGATWRFLEGRKLWNAFDPMGVHAPGGPENDYDAYVEPTLKLCEQGGGADALRAYAAFVVYESIGMHRQPVMDHAIAEFSKRVQKWYASGSEAK
ncbi:MAG TPA: hypothetical protein VG387_03395 [Rhizomicrobium sp.]|nr:hypothetical protein [Rhizomicrobium sp.]